MPQSSFLISSIYVYSKLMLWGRIFFTNTPKKIKKSLNFVLCWVSNFGKSHIRSCGMSSNLTHIESQSQPLTPKHRWRPKSAHHHLYSLSRMQSCEIIKCHCLFPCVTYDHKRNQIANWQTYLNERVKIKCRNQTKPPNRHFLTLGQKKSVDEPPEIQRASDKIPH